MADKKLTIEEMMAAARSQDSGGGSSEEKTGGDSEEAVQETPATEETPAKAPEGDSDDKQAPATAAPSSTADILAALRAEDSGAKPAAEKPEPAAEKPEPAAGKPKPATAPSSTADILAALRAEDAGGGGETETPSEAPAEQTPEKSTPAAAPAADGERPSVHDMLQALRAEDAGAQPAVEKPEPTAETPEPADRSMPQRPEAAAIPRAATTAPATTSRRNFLAVMLLAPCKLVTTPMAAAWTALTASLGAMLLGTARFMFPNTLVEPPMTFKIGAPSDYPAEQVSSKWKAARGVWIVRSTRYSGQDQIVALASVCTHLGCTPNWLEGEQKFKCPCHGSGFYISGENFEGPAPRPLERVGLSLAPDGMLEVDKSRKFQAEMGQWEDAASFVNV